MTTQTKSERLAESLQTMGLGLPTNSAKYLKLTEAATHILAQEKALESKDKALTAAREALEALQRIDFEHRRLGLDGLPADAVRIIDDTYDLIKEAQ